MNDNMRKTAEEHKAADARCGRSWECCCAACVAARKAEGE